MPSVYRPRRPRASPLWQIVHHGWGDFVSDYEATYRKTHGPLREDSVAVVDQFYRCGDLAAGFTRLQCPECGHEKLLALICTSYYTFSVLADIPSLFRVFPASGSSYMCSPWSFSLRHPTVKVPFARLTRTIREVVPSLGATSAAVK